MKVKKKKANRGNINVSMQEKYETVAKAAKQSGMTPTAFARVALANVADEVLCGRLVVTQPQISAAQSV